MKKITSEPHTRAAKWIQPKNTCNILHDIVLSINLVTFIVVFNTLKIILITEKIGIVALYHSNLVGKLEIVYEEKRR